LCWWLLSEAVLELYRFLVSFLYSALDTVGSDSFLRPFSGYTPRGFDHRFACRDASHDVCFFVSWTVSYDDARRHGFVQ